MIETIRFKRIRHFTVRFFENNRFLPVSPSIQASTSNGMDPRNCHVHFFRQSLAPPFSEDPISDLQCGQNSVDIFSTTPIKGIFNSFANVPPHVRRRSLRLLRRGNDEAYSGSFAGLSKVFHLVPGGRSH